MYVGAVFLRGQDGRHIRCAQYPHPVHAPTMELAGVRFLVCERLFLVGSTTPRVSQSLIMESGSIGWSRRVRHEPVPAPHPVSQPWQIRSMHEDHCVMQVNLSRCTMGLSWCYRDLFRGGGW